MRRAAALRGLSFLGLWLVLAGADPWGLAFGLFAAAVATRASLALLPPAMHMRPFALARLALRVVSQSVLAGADVARRAFDPRLPLRPGLIALPMALPPGAMRDGFRALASLQPGSLPAGLDAEGRLVIHALDTALPIARDTAAAEALLRG
jgi:multicomponent Na+:H+ antiporter subunit E